MEARDLLERARPSIIERWDLDHLHDIDRLIDAIETWTAWNTGRPVTHQALTDSLDALRTAARHAPIVAFDRDIVTGDHYLELIAPLQRWMRQRGINQPERTIERDLDIGLER